MAPRSTTLPVLLALCVALPTASCGGDDPRGSADGSGTDGTGGTLPTTGDATTDTPTGGGADDFGPESEFVLRLNDKPSDPLQLNMNKAEVAELFGDTAKDIALIEVESKTLLTQTLDTIKNACGTAWTADDPDPKHNCDLTELGKTFKGPDNTWKSSPEYSLIRILTMTPANSKVKGTSIAGMQGLADALGIGGGFAQILSESLGIARTEEFITTPELVLALQRNLLATHPAVGGDGSTLPVNLEDALKDLTTLSTKLGPVGNHPGILAPGFQTYSEVLTADFRMMAEADSNLRLLDGIDLSVGKDYMSTIVDLTGPDFDNALEFDFEDPDKFSITGVADNPTVDMRFAVREHATFINSCAGDEACKQNLPENEAMVKAMWPGSAWAIDKWLLEAVVVTGGREKYKNRMFKKCYEVLFTCALGAEVSIGPPSGWAKFDVFLNLGNPPRDQYVWELINEVAQVALHTPPSGDIPEGQANVEFTLFDIPIGITGPQVAEAVRPFLQQQAGKISELLLGDYKKNNGAVDFYYRRGADGVPYLFFVTAEDLADGTPADLYKNPGFFSCPAVSADCKVSTLELGDAGDTTHEKVKLAPGETTLYLQDDTGEVYRAAFNVPDSGDPVEIGVRVAAKK
ncbi:hypothetical protein [Nannocystis sp.]|uniref:hypothetical protein n=1 Tax=Nannocystis sp. TaxID=1962667 RepID=UPI0025F108FB|nr:hypothetical protein [Nannocystis sp.]MBK7825841.1 hypothetical protein [Nannocystis sp.]